MQSTLELLEDRFCFATTGLPDTSFGNNGVATISFRSTTANDLAIPVKLIVDSGKRTYVVAHTTDTLQVRRLNSHGALDTSFNNNRGLIGLAVNSKLFAGSSPGTVNAAIDPANRLYLLVGTIIYRFNTSGTIDKTFGTNGIATLSGFSGARDITIDSFNRIYISGSAQTGTASDGSVLQQFRVARLRSVGLFDRTFAGKGYYNVPLPTSELPYKDANSKGEFIRVLSDNSVVAVSSASLVGIYDKDDYGKPLDPKFKGAQIVRFNSSGAIDASYGVKGIAQHLVVGSDVTFIYQNPVGIRNDGSVIMFYRYSSYDSDARGAYNQLISTRGKLSNIVWGAQAFQQADFELIPGNAELVVDRVDSELFRFKPDGSLDPDFISNGTSNPIKGVKKIALSTSDSTVLTVGSSSKRLYLNIRKLFL